MYYAAKALLSVKGIVTKTHRGLIAQISDQYVKPGLLDYETWAVLPHTEPLHESADYDSGEEITEVISYNVLINCKHFLQTCEALFQGTTHVI